MMVNQALALLAAWRDAARSNPADEDLLFFEYCLHHLAGTKSQLFQDLWVAYELADLRLGYFVEFGAGDGVRFSNTHYLEKVLDWRGVLAEPGRGHHPALHRTRDCAIDTRCIWHRSGEELVFNETEERELSTIDAYSESDNHAAKRRNGTRYTVATVSLDDLLREHAAPRRIDYMSVDTEGSELDILSAFDFGRWDVRLLSVEHNFTAQRGPIHDLMVARGYRRKFEGLSRWDDWYVKIYS